MFAEKNRVSSISHCVFCVQARGKKRQSGLFPGSHVKILDRKAPSPASPATEDVSISRTFCVRSFFMSSRDKWKLKIKVSLRVEVGLVLWETRRISRKNETNCVKRELLRETRRMSREMWLVLPPILASTCCKRKNSVNDGLFNVIFQMNLQF